MPPGLWFEYPFSNPHVYVLLAKVFVLVACPKVIFGTTLQCPPISTLCREPNTRMKAQFLHRLLRSMHRTPLEYLDSTFLLESLCLAMHFNSVLQGHE